MCTVLIGADVDAGAREKIDLPARANLEVFRQESATASHQFEVLVTHTYRDVVGFAGLLNFAAAGTTHARALSKLHKFDMETSGAFSNARRASQH